jgi:hypothetical protein
MSTELDALMLANALEVSDKHPELINVNNRAAAELRRLHAEVEELRGALDEAMWHVKYKELKAVNESDTALLRQALEALKQHIQLHDGDCICQDCAAITALRERLGEKT